jgi:hypothetical protein
VDFLLIICQVKGEWQTKDEKLKSYQKPSQSSKSIWKKIEFTYISRVMNQYADALATLKLMIQISCNEKV